MPAGIGYGKPIIPGRTRTSPRIPVASEEALAMGGTQVGPEEVAVGAEMGPVTPLQMSELEGAVMGDDPMAMMNPMMGAMRQPGVLGSGIADVFQRPGARKPSRKMR